MFVAVDDALPVLPGTITLFGALLWGIAAAATRRRWHMLGAFLCAALTSAYAAEAFGWDHTLGVRWVRIISIGSLGFSMVAVPAWITHVTIKHRKVVGEAEQVVTDLLDKGSKS